MTEKRYFALIGEDGYVYPVFFDSENEDKEIDVDIVVDLLNENEQLKHQRHEDINELSVIAMKYKSLKEENEQLRKELTDCEKFRHTVFKKINEVMTDDQ